MSRNPKPVACGELPFENLLNAKRQPQHVCCEHTSDLTKGTPLHVPNGETKKGLHFKQRLLKWMELCIPCQQICRRVMLILTSFELDAKEGMEKHIPFWKNTHDQALRRAFVCTSCFESIRVQPILAFCCLSRCRSGARST